MADKAWKEFERIVALKVGGVRRGAYTGHGGKGEGKTDVIHDVLGVEVKLLKSPTWGKLLEAIRQAADNSDQGLYPLAVMKQKGARWEDAIVACTLDEFAEFCKRAGIRVEPKHTE